MRKLLAWISYFSLFIILTIVTQIGGIVLLFSSIISNLIHKQFRFKKSIVFLSCYLITTIVVVPVLAPFFGREKVIHSDYVSPTTFATVILNRNYVKPELNELLRNVADRIANDRIHIKYLDANFPFLDGFPLIPHLSHSDGKKIDISFVYSEPGQSIDSKKKKSLSGYGVFEGPKTHEVNQIEACRKRGYWQYDFPKYLTFGTINNELKFSDVLNVKLIQSFLTEPNLGKIFIEPHLKKRLRLEHEKIRFHGCQSVRHDDHLHIQL